MSFDIFVQKFEAGDAGTADEGVIRALLAPHTRALLKGSDTAVLHFADGTADLYGWDDLSRGFMINHAGGAEVWDVLVRVAQAAGLAIMPIGCPIAVTSAADVDGLPAELKENAVVVASGEDLIAIIRGS